MAKPIDEFTVNLVYIPPPPAQLVGLFSQATGRHYDRAAHQKNELDELFPAPCGKPTFVPYLSSNLENNMAQSFLPITLATEGYGNRNARQKKELAMPFPNLCGKA